ncbi:hypothetical protein K5I29_00760 [Flavobacterium agricola]|uniref:Uncharacterized protein n=1 Tax=Flavobacterium agricola TaxID=2870839 RepID=A0ABY6LYV1_9FLAO|nr:hypothetical protein [Flavobacterium agricola]UYW01507.1 hypothetical protein K5I29_00760 [Flavobacterium agricola]
MDIQDLILKDLDTLMQAKSQYNGLNIQDVIEICAYVGASVLRQRYKMTQEVNDSEINHVYGIIGNFCFQSFKDNFGQEQFDEMLIKSLNLLKEPTFDQDCLVFFDRILNLKKST